MTTNADLVRSFAHAMSVTDLAHWGVPSVAYVKKVAIENDETGWGIYAADGTQLGVASSRDLAFASVRQYDLDPHSAH